MEVRRAQFDDVKDVTEVIQKTGGVSIYKATFGTYNLSSMIENSYLSLLSSDSNKETISYISVNDGINIINTDPDAYGKIVNALKNYIPATMSNLMFVNFWVLDESSKHYEEACFEMIKKAFTIASHIDYFVWVVPKNFLPSDFILHTFSLISFGTAEERAQESIQILNGYKVLFLHRSNFLPRLQVREARIEDNDDLIPILQHSNPDILVGQESFFLADLIQKQDDVNRFYVGLKKSSIAGMLATSLDVNVSLIQKVFDVSPFPDLMIKKEERPLPPPLLISIVGDLRLVDVPTLKQAVQDLNCLFINAETMKLPLPVAASTGVAESKSTDAKKTPGDDKNADSKGKAPPAAEAKAPTPKAGSKPAAAAAAEAKDAVALKADSKDAADAKNDGLAPEAPAISPLQAFLESQLQAYTAANPANPLSGIVLFGYPRSENEAYERLQEMIFNFDYLIEVRNIAEDAEEDEEDEFLQHHLDAVEVLKDQYYASEGKTGETPTHRSPHHGQHSAPTPTAHATPGAAAGRHKASWRRIAVAGAGTGGGASEAEAAAAEFGLVDSARSVAADLTRIVDHRQLRIETQRQRDREEPPKANAFALTVFCMEPDFDTRGSDLIKIAFEDHPNQDYCLFMFGNDKPPSADQLRCMTYVNLLPGVSFDQSFYLMHRSAFLVNEHLRVKRVDRDLVPSLEEFASTLAETERTTLLEGVRLSIQSGEVDLRDNPAEVCFAVTIGTTIVGTVNLSRRINSNEDAVWLRANYHIDDLINFERHRVRNQAIITQWMLDPVYSPFTRRVVQDIMRQYGKTLLYYHTPRDVCPPKNILEEFVALKPRRRMQSGGTLQAEMVSRPSASIGGLGNDCPLYCITKYFLSNPKDTIAKRVVIVGGSAHAYGVLDTLCSVPHLHFPNVYLVIEKPPAALTLAPSENTEESRLEESYSGCFSVQNEHYPIEQELFAMGLSHKISLLPGHLSDIDREHKAVVISDETVLEYDILILSTCTQDGSTMSIPSLSRTHPARCADIGVFSLGNAAADAKALRYVRQRYSSRSDDVVVSGSGLAVFATVAKLLKFGLSPTRITVVVREEEGSIQGLFEKNITDPLVKGVLSAGIKMCWGFTVAEVHLSHTGFLSSLELKRTIEAPPPAAFSRTLHQNAHSEAKTSDLVMVSCLALLLCTNSMCDRDVFSAVVDSGLVFDGGLVVDTSFRTVDPSIYALSDYTRFSRVYKDALPHSSLNPREVGAFVALKILEQQLDPTMARPHQYATPSAANSALTKPYVAPNRINRPPLPVFLLPRSVSCDLPGGLYYFSSSLPNMPAEAVSYNTNSQMADAAGDVRGAARNRNFVLKTDLLGTVVEITYVGEDAVENRNLALLPGMHEAYLNSAAHMHGKGYVTDWVEYFRQEWAAVIYQDRFPVLVHALRRSLASDKGMLVMLNRVFERAESCADDMEVADQRRELLGAHGELAPETTLRTIETETIEFLKENRALLPRFYLPDK